MALPATFDFTASDGTQLNSYDSRWTQLDTVNLNISGNQLRTNAGIGFFYALLDGETPNADQEISWDAVDAQVGTREGDFGCGVRGSGTAAANMTGYFMMTSVGTGTLYLRKVVSGSVSELRSYSPPATGATVKIKVTGTSPALLEVFYNGVSQGTHSDSSSPITSGKFFLATYAGQGGNGQRMDNVVVANVLTAPTAPSGVTAGSITTTGATISWTDASSDETGFKVQTAPSPFSSWTTASGSPTAANATSLAVTGLSPGTTYKARVASTNANGDSAWVESGEFTTTGGQKGRALLLGVG